MEFELSAEQEELAAAARSLLDGRAGPARLRAYLAEAPALPFDQDLWRAMAEQGWLGVAVTPELGGLGLGWVEAAVLLEEAGRHVAPVPLLPTLLALDALTGSDQATARRWVRRLIEGHAVGCVAWSPDPSAVMAGPGQTLSGRIGPVVGAPLAEVAVVWTPHTLYAVDLVLSGRPACQPAMDPTQALGWLDLDDTPAVCLGEEEAARVLIDRAALATSAELLGGATHVLEMTAAYARERVQFGRPIGSFQAVKHRCADMVVDVEGMRSSTWYGAWCLAGDEADRSVAASAAKVWCADAARRVMVSGLQVHGGIGFTWDHDLHLHLKRAELDQVSFGDSTYHRERLAGLLERRVQAGRPVI